MDSSTKRGLIFLGVFTLYFTTIWGLWDTALVYPLKVFVVLLHEISHGLVAIATGGTIQKIVLNPNQGGACYCPGGNAFMTLSAGYLGSLGFGGLLLTAGNETGRWSRYVTGFVGAAVIILTLLYVRSLFGVIFGAGFGAALVVAARNLPAAGNKVVLITLGLTSCLYAILDIKSDIIDRPELRSDARMLAELTGVPTAAWGFIWITIAVVVSAFFLWRAYLKGTEADEAEVV